MATKYKVKNFIPTCRFYKVPTRFFNIIFVIEDLQGDGSFILTLIMLWRAIQFVLPFPNDVYKNGQWVGRRFKDHSWALFHHW